MTGILAALQTQPIIHLSAAARPTSVTGYGNTGAAANISTGLTTVTPTGGVGPYTHAWSQVGTTPYTWVIGSAAAATTGFTCNTLGPGTTSEAAFIDTVTDATGKKATAAVSAFANNGQPYDNRVGRDFLDRGNQ